MLNRTISVCLGGAALLLPFLCQGQNTYSISTVAGNGTAGFGGDGSAATGAQLFLPFAAVFAGGTLYISDQVNNRVRTVASGGTITTVAGNGTGGYSGDGKAASAAELLEPTGLAVDSKGNLYISDTGNEVIRMVTGGNISTFAGSNSGGAGFTGDGGAASSGLINRPSALAFNSSGNLYIADTANNVIRLVTASTGYISTVAGNSAIGYYGDGGPAISANFDNPEGVAVDAAGNIYISDTGNNAIRKVTTDGIVRTIAGGVGQGYSGDGGPATKAMLSNPEGIALDAGGNLYIADTFNQRIRMVTPSGTIYTVAGSGVVGYTGDGGAASSATLRYPTGVAADPSSTNLYVVDNGNNVIRLLTLTGSGGPSALPAIVSGGVIGASAFGGFSSIAPGSWIEIYGTNLAADTRVATLNGNSEPTSLDGTQVTIGGQLAFISFISSLQVNVQVPSNVGTGQQQLTVTTAAGTSASYTVNVNATQPGVLAPAPFNFGGKQYVAALFPDNKTYVLPPEAIQGLTSRAAKSGDTIIIYGVGFGPTTPNIPAGQVAQQASTVNGTVTVSFNGVPGKVAFAGLSPGSVGLYQINVVVPTIPNSNSVPLTISLNGGALAQILYTAVQN